MTKRFEQWINEEMAEKEPGKVGRTVPTRGRKRYKAPTISVFKRFQTVLTVFIYV
jgi:hypothetical protein